MLFFLVHNHSHFLIYLIIITVLLALRIKIINKEGQKNNRILKCLLQLKVSKEDSKFGLEADALKKIIFSDEYSDMENIKISGIMAMATNTTNKDIVLSLIHI